MTYFFGIFEANPPVQMVNCLKTNAACPSGSSYWMSTKIHMCANFHAKVVYSER